MTALIALAAVAMILVGILVLAGREQIRLHGLEPRPVRSWQELLHQAGTGYRALDHASQESARRRLERGWWA